MSRVKAVEPAPTPSTNWGTRYAPTANSGGSLASGSRADSEAPPDIREVSNVWLFAKDGRHFVRNPEIAARVIRK